MAALSDIDEVRLTIVALTASLVRAIEPTVPGFSVNVIQELQNLQRELRYSDHQRTVEAIAWTRDLIRQKFVAD